METSVRLELLVGQQQKKANLIRKALKKAITLCGEKFSTLSGEGEEISGYWIRCWDVQRQLSVSSPVLPMWEQRYRKVLKKLAVLAMNPQRIQLSVSHVYYF